MAPLLILPLLDFFSQLVLAIPEEEVVVALTLNHLSSESVARKRILGIIFDELRLEAPASITVEEVSEVMAQV